MTKFFSKVIQDRQSKQSMTATEGRALYACRKLKHYMIFSQSYDFYRIQAVKRLSSRDTWFQSLDSNHPYDRLVDGRSRIAVTDFTVSILERFDNLGSI
jgi:hypothetical protein